ncbi:MAG: tripartite tricarboxylate transporter substrate binding protein [Alphaproteobacteria bacterium]|nr:tripartite tricarboxylate transporter substrate binding protein [Alphaproteobacteria bacterium]
MRVTRTLTRALAAAALVAGFALPANAQSYPSRNVTMIVAFPAGGIADIIGRLVATKLSDRLKQSVVVENRGGGGGNIAGRAVATAAGDGYTVLTTTTSIAVNHTASKNRGFETRDLRPVAIVAFTPDVLAVHPSNPAKTLKEFIANAKEKQFTYGSAGPGTAPQIHAEYFFGHLAKVKYVHVPFQGGAPAITAALGNHVDSTLLSFPPMAPHLRSGALRGLGIASEKRNKTIPGVPTYAEQGFPNFYSGSWIGIFAPAKTPDAVVARLNAEITALMKEPDAVDRLTKAGFDPMTNTVAEAEAYFKREIESWGKMVTATGFSN